MYEPSSEFQRDLEEYAHNILRLAAYRAKTADRIEVAWAPDYPVPNLDEFPPLLRRQAD